MEEAGGYSAFIAASTEFIHAALDINNVTLGSLQDKSLILWSQVLIKQPKCKSLKLNT